MVSRFDRSDKSDLPDRQHRDETVADRPMIALVDADGRGVTTFTEPLERKGYTVIVCPWGNGLRAMAAREQPDLLIVDIGEKRRWILRRILRQMADDPLTGHIPVLVNLRKDNSFYRVIAECVGAPSNRLMRK